MSVPSVQDLLARRTDFLNGVLQGLRQRIRKEQFETWFRDFQLITLDESGVEFSVPNGFVREWLTRNFMALIRDSVRLAGGKERGVQIRIASRLTGPGSQTRVEPNPPESPSPTSQEKMGLGNLDSSTSESASPAGNSGPAANVADNVLGVMGGLSPSAPAERQGPSVSDLGRSLSLNHNYTFDSFVVGPCNRLAQAAALAIGANPGRAYNPFFVHGGVGLGKTHVLHAICHQILRSRPNHRVLYLSCEEFTNAYIKHIQNETLEEFRSHLRSVDVLAIDDVEFLANKERTQEEFFHTFNSLYNSQKQIVLSSDRPASEIPNLQERLVSRFKWGLEADMQPPCFETRVAIIKRKARIQQVALPDPVAHYIAETVDTNIRELEGAVIKVVGISAITDRKISLALAEEALRGLGAARSNQISLANIMTLITSEFSISARDLTGKSRTQAVCLPRQIGMFLARQHTDHSLEEVGRFFGNRDHTTVLYAVSKIKNRIAVDRIFQDLLAGLSTRLQSGYA
ncbi:MAG: chromosomal replication initiator protein DnaA [Planctomycetota bacterium]|jgi:chromosomal replication initiator protein|nr:chromosomal replication initiator protein DnaA [Planctomycetota bacterium]